MCNQARNPCQYNELRAFGRRAFRADRAAKIIFALLAVAHHAAAQLPPDATIVHIDDDCTQSVPHLNEMRQVIYQCGDFPVSSIVLYENGELLEIVDDSLKNIAPTINNDGVVVWSQGLTGEDFDVLSYSNGLVNVVSAAPYPETRGIINHDGDIGIWARTCWPVPNDCVEIEMLLDASGVVDQWTFGGPVFQTQPPSLANDSSASWSEFDFRFGIFNSTTQIIFFNGSDFIELESFDRQLGSPIVNDSKQIIWGLDTAPVGPILLASPPDWKVIPILPFGNPLDINNSSQIVFWGANFTNSWLYRYGLFWQPFDGMYKAQARDINDRGDVVGRTSATIPRDPGDVFLMLSEPIRGDYDQDGDIDLADAAGLHDCMIPPTDMAGQIRCQQLDFDENGSVDLRDVADLMNVFFGDCGLGIATPPNGNDVCEGGSFSISVDVRGNVASYQWLFGLDQVEIDGATEATLTIENASESQHEGEYGVHVTSECGWEATSKRRHLIEVHSHAPVFDDQPESQAVCEGSTVRFCPSLSGSQDDPYDFVNWQWQKNGVDMPDAANWNCLWLRDVNESDAGSYRVVATNGCGSTVSAAATLSIVEPSSPPTITGHPTTGAYPWVGQSITPYLHVVAECAESYQWHKNGEPIPGATEMRIEFPNVKCSDTGAYHVDVINSHGTTVSQNGAMNVQGCE